MAPVSKSVLPCATHNRISASRGVRPSFSSDVAEFTDGIQTTVLRTMTVGPVLKISLIMTYTAGGYNDGYADNLAFLLVTNRPTLNISAANKLVFWSTNFSDGYSLQQNTNLVSTNWVAMTNTVLLVGATNQVSISPMLGNLFFRLSHP